MKLLPAKEISAKIYRRIMDELTPAERKAILTVLSLLVIGAAVKIISSL